MLSIVASVAVACAAPPVGAQVDEGARVDAANGTRLFLGPTARTLPAESGYLQVFEVVVPFLAYGVTDRFTFSFGTPLVFGSGDERVVWVAPKLQVLSRPGMDLAVGLFSIFGAEEIPGILYGVGTFGGDDAALTTGVGYGFIGGDLAERPALLIGGDVRAGDGLRFVTENYLFPEDGGVITAGPRFHGDRFTVDLGLIAPLFDDDVDGVRLFPLVNVVIHW